METAGHRIDTFLGRTYSHVDEVVHQSDGAAAISRELRHPAPAACVAMATPGETPSPPSGSEHNMPDVSADELEALHTPIKRRSAEMIDHLVALARRAGFPIAPNLEDAARVMCGILTMEEIGEGEVLFEEGSESSDIYIVLSGSMHVLKKAVPQPIATVTRGRIFGEMALLHSDPVRHSSIVAAEDTQLGRMSASDIVHHKVDLSLFHDAEQFYKDLQDKRAAEAAEAAGVFAKASPDLRRVMAVTKKPPGERSIADLDHMLATMKSFKLFDPQTGKKFLQNVAQRRAVCAVLHCRTFEPGGCVCAEGEEGHAMYILLYGRLNVSTMNSHTGESQHINDIVQGQDFGELALLGDNKRTATIIASDYSVLLELQRPDYDATFRQADEEEIIEKVQNLTVCPLFKDMSLKKLLRIAYQSKLMMFSKDQTILSEGARSSRIYFVISGLVAVKTVCRTPSQTFLVSLGNRQTGSILGVETALSRDGRSNFTYVALSEVRVLACLSASLTRRCTKEFSGRLTEYAEACLSPAAVNRMVLVETDWIETRNQHHLDATGSRPTPPPPRVGDESRHGGAALRMASAQSLAKLVPPSMASLSASIGQTTPRLNRAPGSVGSEISRVPHTPRLHRAPGSSGSEISRVAQSPRLHRAPGSVGNGSSRLPQLVSEESRAILDSIDRAEVEIEMVDRGMKDLKDRMGSLIELRDEQSGRSTPTPKDIAEQPGEAYRRSLQLRLWDPLVRLNHLGRSEQQKEKETGESRSSTHKEAAIGGAPVVEVDLGRRLPKQFGMFTEMVYGVTVLWATVTCNKTGLVPGLAWQYFLDNLFVEFEEQAQMRGLMRSEKRGVSDELPFILVGGMPHTKSYSQKPDGRQRAAGLVCDVAMRMIEDIEASNQQHENLMVELEHHAASTDQDEPASPRHGGRGQSPLVSPRANGGVKSRADAGADHHKSFDVSIRIGISTGSIAIDVFGVKSPVYFGACGSEVDTARLLALSQPTTRGKGADSVDAMAVLSDSTNELVKDGYFTAEAPHLQKPDAQGNPTDSLGPTTGGANAGGSGDPENRSTVLSGWVLTGKKESFDGPTGSRTTAAAGSASAPPAAQAGPHLTGQSAAGGTAAGATANAVRISNSNGNGAKPRTTPVGTSGAVRLSRSPRRPEHMFRAAQSGLRASARCAPAARQLLSPRMLSARLRPTVSPRVRGLNGGRPPLGAPASMSTTDEGSRSAAHTRPRPSLRVVSPMSLYGRRPFGLVSGGR